jgi:hypothetical protein
MTRLEYSVPALNVLKKFHRAAAIVFVEGQDDLHFWDNIARKADINTLRIEPVYGTEELQKKIEAILVHNAQIIVAKDADHDHFFNSPIEHPRIINTYGYSIENSLYCPNTISRFAAQLARTLDDYSVHVIKWYGEFSGQAELLLVYDVANHIYDRGVKVFGDTCSRFLENSKSPNLSPTKIEGYIDSIKEHFTEEEISNCSDIINKDSREPRWLIKGHFITSAIINLIKEIVRSKRVKNISLSLEHVYSSTISGCSHCIPGNCIALEKMTKDLRNALATI